MTALTSRSFSGRVLIVSCVIAAGALLARTLVQCSDAGAGAADAGVLASYHGEWLGPWETVVAVAATTGAPSDLVAIASSPKGVVLLSSHNWWVVREGHQFGPFGGTTLGEPGWLTRAVSVAVDDDSVFILDGGSGRVVVTGLDGGPSRAYRVVQGVALQLFDGIIIDSHHRPVISRMLYGSRTALTGNWQVIRIDDSVIRDTLYDALRDSVTASPLAIPLLASVDNGRTVIVESETYAINVFPDDGAASSRAHRLNPPRWNFPDSVRAQFQMLAARLPAEQRARWELPTYYPAIRRMAGISGGRLAVLVPTRADSEYVEVIDLQGSALGRVLDLPTSDDLFLTHDYLYRVVETSDSTKILRADFRVP